MTTASKRSLSSSESASEARSSTEEMCIRDSSDGPQQLTPAQFTDLIAELRELAAVFGKKIV